MGYVHCVTSMRDIYKSIDYICACGVVLEIHDGELLIVDGLTGALLPADSITVTAPDSNHKAKLMPSLRQKGLMYAEALEKGFKLVAERHGVAQGTLRKWGREYAEYAQ